jgi:hypothetical protein
MSETFIRLTLINVPGHCFFPDLLQIVTCLNVMGKVPVFSLLVIPGEAMPSKGRGHGVQFYTAALEKTGEGLYSSLHCNSNQAALLF